MDDRMLKKIFQHSAQEDKEKKDTKERTKYEYLEYSNQLQKQVIDTRRFQWDSSWRHLRIVENINSGSKAQITQKKK